jgi:hypothetical protein
LVVALAIAAMGDRSLAGSLDKCKDFGPRVLSHHIAEHTAQEADVLVEGMVLVVKRWEIRNG